MNDNKAKIVLALDVDSEARAKELIDALKNEVGLFKVGKELFTKLGPQILTYIHRQGCQTFLDLKYHDIPATVQAATRAAADLGVSLLNVHASGGHEMLEAACRGIAQTGRKDVTLLAVTVLTSTDQKTLNNDCRVSGSLEEHVLHLASLAQKAGIDGVVASALEIEAIKKQCGPEFVILTPGIRPTWAVKGDQRRIMTPKEALAKGAHYIVIGRPITQAPDPKVATQKILSEIN